MLKLPTLLLLGLSTATYAQESPGTRTFGMGGTGTASADYLESAFHNPALMTRFDRSDDWGLLLPTLAVTVADPDSLLDALDNFEDDYDTIDAVFSGGGTPTQAQLDALADSLVALGGKTVNTDANVGMVLAIPSRSFAAALVVSGYVDAHGFLLIDAADEAAIRGALSGSTLPAVGSEAIIVAAAVTEVKFALAREFEVFDMPLSVGITPKFQQIDVFNFAVTLDDSSDIEDDFDDDKFRTDDSAFNLDLGISVQPHEDWVLGLVLNDTLSPEITTLSIGGRTFVYEMEPVLTAGAAWNHDIFTLAADLDLTSRDPFGIQEDQQFLRLGGEIAWEWAQLRGGFFTDLEDNAQDLITAGLGFSPFGVAHMDLAGAFGEDSYGASLSFSFTF